MKAFRRDKLKRLVEAGRVVMVGSYSFDDTLGADRTKGTEMPVEMDPGDFRLHKEGIVYMKDYLFEGKPGMAYENRPSVDGALFVHLKVHSNLNYDFKIKPATKGTK